MKIYKLALAVISLSNMNRNADSRLSFDQHEWMQVSDNVAFQRNAELSMDRSTTNHATKEAINRMLTSSSKTHPSYYYQSIDSSAIYDEYQLAWRVLGYYVDCSNSNSNGSGCNRQVLYAVYADPAYNSTGLGEYKYYDKSTDEFVCKGGSCTGQMDCHLSETRWQLLGVFKIDSIVGSYGYMAQLFKHEGYCIWGQETYNFASTMRQTIPYGCKITKQKLSNGSYLYYAAKPEVNGNITLGLYTDNMCSTEYVGSTDYDVFQLVGAVESYWEKFNEALDEFKICQPCVAYDLSADGFSCDDAAGYTNANQCMKFSKKSKCKAATTDDIMMASRQQGLVPFNMDNITYGGQSDYGKSTSHINEINTTTTTAFSSITLPFSIPELPEFVTSIYFLAGSVVFFLLGMMACCKTCCCSRLTKKDEKSISLIDASGPMEPSLVKSSSDTGMGFLVTSFSSAAKSITTKVKILLPGNESKADSREHQEDEIELATDSTSISLMKSFSNVAKSIVDRIKITIPRNDSIAESSEQREDAIELCKASSTQTSFDAKSATRSFRSNYSSKNAKSNAASIKSSQAALKEILSSMSAAMETETAQAEANKDTSGAHSAHSKNSGSSRSSFRNSLKETKVMVPIKEDAPVKLRLQSSFNQGSTTAKSDASVRSKKSPGSMKPTGLKMFKNVFSRNSKKGVFETEPEPISDMLSLADSGGVSATSKSTTGGIAHNSCIALGKEIHNNVNHHLPIEDVGSSGIAHDTCMTVGDGVHHCLSPKMSSTTKEDQQLEEASMTAGCLSPKMSSIPNDTAATEGQKDEVAVSEMALTEQKDEDNIVHNSLLAVGKGIHGSLMPSLDEKQDSGVAHNAAVTVGKGVQDIGEGFYRNVYSKC